MKLTNSDTTHLHRHRAERVEELADDAAMKATGTNAPRRSRRWWPITAGADLLLVPSRAVW